MDFARNRPSFLSLRTILLLDAAFEFFAGAALIVFAGILGEWFGMAPLLSILVGVVFLAAGGAILVLRSDQTDPALVRGLALANVIGGAAGWVAFFVLWQHLDPGGRAVLGTASDLFILIGVLEIAALHGSR